MPALLAHGFSHGEGEENKKRPNHGLREGLSGNGGCFAEWFLPFLHGCRRHGGRLGKMAKKPESKRLTLQRSTGPSRAIDKKTAAR
jgi:hypothetical protein